MNEATLNRMDELYFCDVPIYRITKSKYNEELNKYTDRFYEHPKLPTQEEIKAFYADNPKYEAIQKIMLEREYGGRWRFNEIVGHIRLFFLGYQIRGELWLVNVKRFVKSRRKTFFHQPGFRPEVNISISSSNQEIFDCIIKLLNRVRPRFKGRFIDSSIIEQIGPYIDWNSLLHKNYTQ
ncbi:MAG: hypothetical protein ABSG97_09455 [Sedimentisphaerales bacterium]|jgi:hypothetical protein